MVKMLGKRVLCKEVAKVVEAGAIIMLGAESTSSKVFEVIGVGPDVEGVEEGDKVLLPAYTTELTIDREECHMVTQ